MLSGKNAFCMDMTVLERQQARLKWLLQQQQQHNYGNQHNALDPCSMPQFQGFFDHTPDRGELVDSKGKPEMYVGSSGLARYGDFSLEGDELIGNKMDSAQAELMSRSLEIDHCLSRTSSFQMGVADAAKMEEELVAKASGEDVILKEKIQNNLRRQISNKRKAEFATTEDKSKRIKGESMANEKSCTENSTGSSKENQNTSTAQKTDYIHVRARRGQATDSHSLAERARREKISKKMKCLQDLVPGCNKITGRAGMLDEIINYVQSLQRQVEFLSMKLAALSPMTEFNFDSLFKKEFPAHVASFPAAALSSTMDSLSQLPLNLLQVSIGSKSELLKNPHQVVPERTTNSSAFLPEQSLDSSCFSVIAATLVGFFWFGILPYPSLLNRLFTLKIYQNLNRSNIKHFVMRICKPFIAWDFIYIKVDNHFLPLIYRHTGSNVPVMDNRRILEPVTFQGFRFNIFAINSDDFQIHITFQDYGWML